jgi:threonine/homoserine/homoserine lactone efflux protein
MTISLPALLALAAAMTLLAAMPSLSVLAVTSRAAALGLRHGVAVSAGIVLGDWVLILIALLGMALLAEAVRPLFLLLQGLGAVYLLWLGLALLRRGDTPARPVAEGDGPPPQEGLAASLLSGLLLTLADQKALLFYLGFFPAFLDLGGLRGMDVVAVLAITLVSVGGVKLLYAGLAARLGASALRRAPAALGRLAGAGLVLVAVAVAARAGLALA